MKNIVSQPTFLHFVVPNSIDVDQLDILLKTELDIDYPYWLGGSLNWVVQTYKVLKKDYNYITIGLHPKAEAINIAHVKTWRKWPNRDGEYRVSIRADYRRLFNVDFEILQNPQAVKTAKQVYVTYWPLPRIKPRNVTRKVVENIAYAGRIGKRNIDESLQLSNSERTLKGFNFRMIDKHCWHDMQEIDILLAIRDFSARTYDEKPPSKLINAWKAGIPLIAGYDSAFSAIGTPGVDYIRVKTEKELIFALERLRDDSDFYRAIVEAGYRQSQQYTRERVAQEWLTVIEESIIPDFEDFKLRNPMQKLSQGYNYFMDSFLDKASLIKSYLKRLPLLD